MIVLLRPLLILAVVLSATTSAHGQTYQSVQDPAAPVTRGYPVEELAGILGELHYLSFACGAENAQQWREVMLEMLDLEAPTRGAYRERLANSFNEGFRFHERRQTRCGAEAELAREQLASQGRALAESLENEYFN